MKTDEWMSRQASLPYPIRATIGFFRELFDQGEYAAAWLQARDVYEVTIRFVVAVLLSASRERDLPEEGLVLGELSSPHPPTLGVWLGNADRLAKSLAQLPLPPSLAALVGAIRVRSPRRASSSHGPLMGVLKEGLEWRNAEIGHGALGRRAWTLNVDVAARVERVGELLVALGPLGGWLAHAELGGDRWMLSDDPLPARVASASVDLVASDGASLPLSPMVRLVPEGATAYVVVFEHRLFSRTGAVRGSRWIDFVAGRRFTSVDREEVGPVALPPPLEAGAALAVSPDMVDGHIAQLLIDQRLGGPDPQRLLRRSAVDRLLAHIASARAGYVWIHGGPGTGKSWLAAGLAMPERVPELAPDVLVLHLGWGVQQSLAVQARALTEYMWERFHKIITLPLGGSPADLRASLVNLFARAIEYGSTGQFVLVLDGLDEVAVGPASASALLDALPLPDDLPDGAFIVLTSRLEPELPAHVGTTLARLRQGARPESWHPLRLGRDADDVRALTRAVALRHLGDAPEPVVGAVVEASDGSPLRASYLADMARLDPLSIATLGALGLDALHTAYVEHLRTLLGRAFTDSYGPLLGVLAAARERLPLPVLAEVLRRSVDDVYLLLLDLKNLLLFTPGEGGLPRVGLFHVELHRHLRRGPLSLIGHRALAAWAQGASAHDDWSAGYLDRCGGHHLVAAGRADEAIAVVVQRLEAGDPLSDPAGWLLLGLRSHEDEVPRWEAAPRAQAILTALDASPAAATLPGVQALRLAVRAACADISASVDPGGARQILPSLAELEGLGAGASEEVLVQAAVCAYKAWEASGHPTPEARMAFLQESFRLRRLLIVARGRHVDDVQALGWLEWSLAGVLSVPMAAKLEALGRAEEYSQELERRHAEAPGDATLERLAVRLRGAVFSRRASLDIDAVGANEGAVRAFRRAVEIDPGDRHVTYALLSALTSLASCVAALEPERVFALLEELEPRAQPFLFAGASAEHVFHRVIARGNGARGRAAWAMNDRHGAVAYLTEALAGLARAKGGVVASVLDRETAALEELLRTWRSALDEERASAQ